MINYVCQAVADIVKQLNRNTTSHIWILHSDEGMGKSTIANAFANTNEDCIVYKVSDEFSLAQNYYNNLSEKIYNRYTDLLQPLIENIRKNEIHKIIFDLQYDTSKDFFDLIYDLYVLNYQQKYKLDIIIFMESQTFYRNQSVFANYSQLQYLNILNPWTFTDFVELWKETFEFSKIDYSVLSVIAKYSFGNAGVFIQHINLLKFYGILYFGSEGWVFQSTVDVESIVKENFSEMVKKRYDSLEPAHQLIIKKTSLLGYVFEKTDLKNAFNIDNATIVLKSIETLTKLLHFTDITLERGKFESKRVQVQIENMIEPANYEIWCLALAEYYESKIKGTAYMGVERYNLKKKCIMYYKNTNKNERLIFHYITLIPIALSFNQFQYAIDLAMELKTVTENSKEYKHFYNYSYFILFNIYRKMSEYQKSLIFCKQYAKLEKCNMFVNELGYCYAELLYGIGKIPEAYAQLKKLNKEIHNIDDLQLRLNVVSMLSSVEQTLGKKNYIKHFNQALSFSKKTHLENEYYKLLRKANLAHDGFHAISFMKTANEYFNNQNNVLEKIMVNHNIGTECLFYEDTFDTSIKYLKIAYETACEYGYSLLTYIINSLAIYDILMGNYNNALEKIDRLLQMQYEDFTMLTLYLNKTTCLRMLEQWQQAEFYLKKAEEINNKKQNKIPFFKVQIILQKAYIQLHNKNIIEAIRLLEKYMEYSYDDRVTNIVAARIVLENLYKTNNLEIKSKFLSTNGNIDSISIKMAKNHLVICELFFWE